jgi:hypothetical protein
MSISTSISIKLLIVYNATVRADASVLSPCNFITEATVRPSHGRPSGHRPIVRPSIIVRMTTLPETHTDEREVRTDEKVGAHCGGRMREAPAGGGALRLCRARTARGGAHMHGGGACMHAEGGGVHAWRGAVHALGEAHA